MVAMIAFLNKVAVILFVLMEGSSAAPCGWWPWPPCGNDKCLQNCFDKHLYKVCSETEAFHGVTSYHNNHHEDRIWSWNCQKVITKPAYRFNSCYWVTVNSYDHQMDFKCHNNYVIRGVKSDHHNGHEDRVWKFLCCRTQHHITTNCQQTGYVNDYDRDINYKAGAGYVIVGAFSVHHNGYEDRRWKFKTCKYTYCPFYPDCSTLTCDDLISAWPLKCSCYNGYELLSNGHSCQDVNECANNNGGCNQICTNKPGSFKCHCYPGYQLSGKSCYDINECNNNNGGCQDICTNTVGSFFCSCNNYDGFSLSSDAHSCIDINECYYNNGGCEHLCTNTYGGHQCSCYVGYKLDYTGKTCSIVCWDPCKKCAECNAPNNCDCFPGWTGPSCCQDINECLSNNGGCAQNCHNTQGSYYCSCAQGYQISLNDKGCSDIDECSSDGTHGCEHVCTNIIGSYLCYCNPGYILADNQKSCIDANECHITNGECAHTCINTAGSYKCTCNDGYTLGSDQQSCLDINECDLNPLVCEHNCFNTKGSYKCDCDLGYQLIGDHCSDIDECVVNNGGCEPGHLCINDVGSFHCECNEGYILDFDGLGCSDHDECQIGNHNCEQKCSNSHGTFTCSCNNGYRLLEDKRSCQDIDECSEYISGCNQMCSNSISSYSCSCYNGYQLLQDKHTCIDINECTVNNGGCEHQCTNTGGNYTCGCQDGFQLNDDDHSCSDINECDNYNGGCDQTCINEDGSYHCLCEDGYTLNNDKSNCDDIDECSSGTHGCSHTCHNIVGSYYCSCDEGYTLSSNDDRTCNDIDECSEGEAGCDQTCTNTLGSYICSCKTGYVLNGNEHTCNDINECITNNGGCGDNCTNFAGSYLCFCGIGYKLAADNHLCEDIDECNSNDNYCEHICINSIGSYECRCEVGYSLHVDGFECDDINECNWSNGTCSQNCYNIDGSYYCDCRSGFLLTNDSHNCTDIPECQFNLCEQNCTEIDGSYLCSCVNGYLLANDSHGCEDIDECLEDNGGCQQFCTNINGSFICSCSEGYELNGVLYCEDIDECSNNNGGCQETCSNIEGSYDCSCPLGYQLAADLHSCEDINECVTDNGGCNQSCTNDNGTYKCECGTGYTLHPDGKDCDDIDECTSVFYVHECSQMCHNVIGSYECSCEHGYTLDETDKQYCHDIDECSEDSANCTQLCSNTNGSYTCSCYSGYTLDSNQYSCNDINECITNNGGCEDACTNTIGSYECYCVDNGYKVSIDNHSCEDIQECDLNIHQCQHNCTNTIGSYECSCNIGYILEDNGYMCKDFDECEVNNGGCDQYCNNEVGSYNCECEKGYNLIDDHACLDIPECDLSLCYQICTEEEGSYSCSCFEGFLLKNDNHSCEDIDECSTNNHNCHHQCNNTIGSYECLCDEGYSLLNDGYTCEDINECDSEYNSCDHHCKNKLGSYSCSCKFGYNLNTDGYHCNTQACSKLSSPPSHGFMYCLDPQVTDTNCTFSCEPGYDIVGSSVTICQPDNSWSNPQPSCILSNCKPLESPSNSYHVEVDGCLTKYGSDCESRCIDGYRQVNGNAVRSCVWSEEMKEVFWNGLEIVCERISPCESQPCLHKGECSEDDNIKGYICDCSDTGYKGDICNIGIIEITTVPLLLVNVPSLLIKLSAHPDDALTVELIMDDAIMSSIQDFHFNKDVTSTLFQLTGKEEGIHFISFEFSGAAKEFFQVPSPLILFVKNNTDINPINENATVLPSGCCEYHTQYNCSAKQNISLSSSCEWQNHSSLVTSGMVYLQTDNLHVPISIGGLNITSSVDQFEHSLLPSTLTACGSCTSSCNSQIPSFDVVFHSLIENTFKKAFFDSISHLVPEAYSISLENFVDFSSIIYSQNDFINFFGTGQELINQGICSGLSVTVDNVYATTIIDRSFSLNYSNTIFHYNIPNHALCIAIELCDSPTHQVLITIPTGLSNGFKESLVQNNLLELNDQFIVKEALIQKSGIDKSVPSGYPFWNGQAVIGFFNEKYDTKLVMSLEKNFKSSDYSLTMNFVFNGEAYHHSNLEQFDTTGMLVGQGSTIVQINNLRIEMSLSTNTPLYFSLQGYSSEDSSIFSGIAFKANHITHETMLSLLPKSPGIDSCSFDCFIQLASHTTIQTISLLSSCVSPSINGLSFHGGQNGFQHSVLLRPNNTDSSPFSPFNPNTAPFQVLSDVPTDGVVLNSFMKVLQPDSGSAVSVNIWPDINQNQNSYAYLPIVRIDLFDVQVTTSVTIDNNGVHFEYDAMLFDTINARITVNSISDGDWDDIAFIVLVDIQQNQDFITDIHSSIKMQISNKINLLSNRLSSLQSVQQILYSLIEEQNAKANHSKIVLDMLSSQLTELDYEIDIMEAKYWTLEHSYEQTKGINDDVMNENLKAVCNIEQCEYECLSLPTFKVETDFDYINEWAPIEQTTMKYVVREVTGMTLDKQWNVNKQCWPITLIKDWGKTAVGQECSYQSQNTESMYFKTQTVMEQHQVESYHSKLVNSYSYREDWIKVNDDECGLNVSSTKCLAGNNACVVMWNIIYNHTSDSLKKQLMKPLLDLADIELNVETKKLKLSHLNRHEVKYAEKVYKQDLFTLENLHDVHQSVVNNSNLLQIQLTYFKSFVTADTFKHLNITSFTVSSVLQSQPNDTVTFKLEFYLPTHGVNVIELEIDISLPLPVIMNLITDGIFRKVSSQESPTFPITSQIQFNKHKCSLIQSVEAFSNQLFNFTFNQEQVTLNAIANLTAVFNQHEDMQINYNITNINFEALNNLFSIEYDDVLLKEMIDNKTVALTMKNSLLEIEKYMTDVLKNSGMLQFYTLLKNLDNLHSHEKIQFINNEICFGLFDCLYQIDKEMHSLYIKSPVKSATYSEYYGANNMFNISLLLSDTSTIATVLTSMSEYWCNDPPVFTDISDVSQIIHIGSTMTLSCNDNLQSNVPVTGYKWRKNGYYMSNENTETLIIDSVIQSDSGWYQCVVTNGIGYTKSPLWTVTVIKKPKISSEPMDKLTFEGNDNGALFGCNASIQAGSEYSWFYSKYGEGNWNTVTNDSNDLIIKDPLKSDEGWYRCHIKSVNLELVTVKAHLTVLDASISELWQNVYFEIQMSGLSELLMDENVNTSIQNQLVSMLKPEYTEIKVKNMSLFEDSLTVEINMGIRYEYIPLMRLSVQADEAIKYKQDLVNVVNELEARITSSQLVFVFGQNPFKTISESLLIGKVHYLCPPGKELQQSNNFICVSCLPGQYSDNNECKPCPLGTYQSNFGEAICDKCSLHYGTEFTGASEGNICKAYCEPGSISVTGFPPCTACNDGYYQLDYGRKSCDKCLPTDYLITPQCTQYNNISIEQVTPTPSLNDQKQIKSSNTNVLKLTTITTVTLIGAVTAMLVIVLLIALALYIRSKGKGVNIVEGDSATVNSSDLELTNADKVNKVNPLFGLELHEEGDSLYDYIIEGTESQD